MPCDVTTET